MAEATGLPITLYLHDKQGAQQIGARIAYNEIDLVLYFCDPAHPTGHESVNKLARLCDQYMIPMATNVATAEVLIQGLRRGDLDWRDIVNPKKITIMWRTGGGQSAALLRDTEDYHGKS